jgi:hypothetical protein
MLPFWKMWGDEKQFEIEDEEKGIRIRGYEKTFSGKQGSVRIQGKVSSFSMESTGAMLGFMGNMLSAFNPFGMLLSSGKPSVSKPEYKVLEDRAEK